MLSNIRLKLFSLALAIFLSYIVNYFFVGQEGRMSMLQLIVPVEVQNVPDKKMILLPQNRQVEVTIHGPSLWVSRVASTPPVFRVSIPEAVQNRHTVLLKRELLNLPPYVDVLNIKPSEMEFTLDNRISKTVPVNVPRIGSLGENVKLDSIKVLPERIVITGPETEIKNIAGVESTPLDLREVRESLHTELSVRVPGTLTEVNHERVSVDVAVSTLLTEKSFEGMLVEVRAPPGMPAMVEPKSVKLVVSGSSEALTTIKKEDIIPYVRVNQAIKSMEKVKIVVDAPKALTIKSIEPEMVTVTINLPNDPDSSAKIGSQQKKGKK